MTTETNDYEPQPGKELLREALTSEYTGLVAPALRALADDGCCCYACVSIRELLQ